MLPAPAPIVVVEQDLGGVVADYAARIQDYRGRKVSVRIEGDCASACTLLTGLPADRVCVSPATRLGFHQAWNASDPSDPDPSEVVNRSDAGTALMMRFYPRRIRAWIARQGGLTARMIVLQGAELRRMFRMCPGE